MTGTYTGAEFDTSENARKAFEKLITLPMPQLTFYDFVNNISPAGVMSVLTINNRPLATLLMSHSMAKTYARALADLVRSFEEQTKIDVKTIHEIAQSLPDGPVSAE